LRLTRQRLRGDKRLRGDRLGFKGLDSGQPIPVTAEYWEEKKRRLTERLSKAIHPQ